VRINTNVYPDNKSNKWYLLNWYKPLAKSAIEMKIEKKTIIKYLDIILQADKKDSFFDIYDILVPKYLKAEADEREKKYFIKLKEEIIEFGEYENYIEQFDSGHFKLTEKGKTAKKKGGHLNYEKYLENKTDPKTVNYNLKGATIGQINHESNFEKSPNKITLNTDQNNKPDKKSFLKRVFLNPYVIGIVLIAIEEYKIGTIYKFIISMIE